MHYHTKSRVCWYRFVWCFLFSILMSVSVFTSGCGKEENTPSGRSGQSSASSTDVENIRDSTPVVLTPEASGEITYEESNAAIDASNASEGYIMLNYTGTNEKVKFQIKTPDGTEYTYLVTETGKYIVYPLSGGNGTYQFTLLEAASAEDNLYAVVFTQSVEVPEVDEFSPYLYPNHFVDFTAGSAAVEKGKELAEDCTSDLDVVSNIYHYVIQNVSYDTQKAESVTYGYTPDVDDTLESGQGICFDYAALMSAMLRSQRIPTKLEVGYVGEAYHAWISCYVDEIGWVDNIIEFDGESWSLIDPTLAANNDSDSVKEYIGDGSHYIIKYTY